MNVFAHRGCAAQYPENTVAAVEAAAPLVDAVELDVRRCGTGELVVFHDERLDRVTETTGRVDETPLDRLQSLSVAGSDEPIPTLAACLEATPNDLLVNVELKEQGLAADVHKACTAVDNEVLVSSFDTDALAEMRAVAQETPVAVIEEINADAALGAAKQLDAEAVHPSLPLAAAGEFVERAMEQGLVVNIWTLTESWQVETAHKLGVDGVIVDRWDIVE